MPRLTKLIRTALRSALLIALLLLCGIVLNGLLLGYAVFRMANTDIDSRIGEYADTLANCNNEYALEPAQRQRLEEQNRFLMLLDEEGRVVWSFRKPAELPDAYTRSDITRFTRWYLMDYPVHVRTMEDGLLVLGFPKGSVWKYTFETPLPTVLFWPVWAAVALLCNFLLILVLSVAVTSRAYKKRDEARTEWIAAVSHDVRTPLAAVLGYAGSLESDALLPETEREQAALIRIKGEELRTLIEDLNLTNRLEHSMEPLQAEWLSPAAVVRETVVGFLNDDAFGRYPIDVDIRPDAAGMQLYGDRALLSRMLKNLIGNSIRHNPDGCSVTVQLDASGRKLTLSVSDTGIGFTEAQLLALREKRMPLTSGHGLGLTIVQEIAVAHNGRVRFRNGADGGSNCTVCFRGIRLRKAPAVQGDGDS